MITKGRNYVDHPKCVMAKYGSGIKWHPGVDLKRTLVNDEITMSSFLAVEEGLGWEFSIVLHLAPNSSQLLYIEKQVEEQLIS